MALSYTFDTGWLTLTNGQTSQVKFTGDVTRTGKTTIKINAKLVTKYNMETTTTMVGLGYGTSYKAYSGNSSGNITNGYTQLYYGKHPVDTPSSGGFVTIFNNKTFTVPANRIYLAMWFYQDPYYHTTTGTLVNNVNIGNNITTTTGLDQFYTEPSGYVLEITNNTVNSITAKHSWTAGSDSITTKTINIGTNSQTVENGSSYTFTNLNSNTKYTVTGNITDGTTPLTDSEDKWTYPQLDPIDGLLLTLPSGLEHDQIKADAKAENSSDFDQFTFKLDSGDFSSWDDSSELYSDLEGHSTHTVTAKMKNTDSGYESVEVSKQITTWYDPIYSLSVSMVNRWFWYISTKAIFDYQGGSENIAKYEFSIGDESYQDKGTANAYSKGTTTPGNTNNLKYNTDYICKVKLTDNHGRTKEASATFKTLDERPLFIDGQLREVKVIKPDGSVHYITPNLLSVVKSDNTVVNMNKIINNDDRTTYN